MAQCHPLHKLVCVLTSLPLDVLNVYWYNKIIRMAVQTLSKQKQKRNEGVDDDDDDRSVKLLGKQQMPVEDNSIASRLQKDSNNNISRHHIE